MESKRKGILIDVTRCIGCGQCASACQTSHGLIDNPQPKLSATAFTVIQPVKDRNVRRMCMHCEDPACVSACPVGALKKSAIGAVIYDASLCIGCRYCMIACPFGVPKYEWTKLAPYVKKCDMCYARQLSGQQPACTEVCPVQAAEFGDREELLEVARQRIRENPDKYVRRVYGSEEVGGTSVMFLSDVPFEELGFVAPAQGKNPVPVLTAAALGDVPTVVLVGGSMLSALYWVHQRKLAVALAEEAEKQDMKGGK